MPGLEPDRNPIAYPGRSAVCGDSRESRDRLVFMVEARPDAGVRLVPGLPVDVYPIGARP